MTLVDLTTTSVGRDTLLTAYGSFLSRVRFSGTFRVVVTVDPAYGVTEDEIGRTTAYLESLPARDPRVVEVVVDRLPRPTGLARSLSVLFAHARADVGVHLEDDWEFIADVPLDDLLDDLRTQRATAIVFANAHVARGGTFTRDGWAEPVHGARVPLLRLLHGNWASGYLPLCPHLHDARSWLPIVARGLALTDDAACPDERVREHLARTAPDDRPTVLWTSTVLARDIGRDWLRARGLYKAITNDERGALSGGLPRVGSGPLLLDNSTALRRRALAVIPGMTQTYQKRPENFADGAYPVYLESGDGALVRDVDGNQYIDFVCALGAATLGHNHPAVTTTIRERVSRGVLLSLPARAEVSAAEELARALPGVEMVRFLKTGAEACAAALRLARHLTGRDLVLAAGYHGWHDGLGGRGPGVPEAVRRTVRRVELADPAAEEALLDEVQAAPGYAAVLVAAPYHRRLTPQFLPRLREACTDTGALLVVDDVVTGFRLGPGGLAGQHGVDPDLVVLSKGLAAGMPLAALAGPARSMAPLQRLTVSTTFGGELLSLEVMRAALREYGATDYYQRIHRLGHRLQTGFAEAAAAAGIADPAVGYHPMPCLRFSANPEEHARRARSFLAAMARRGVLLRRDVNFISAAHSDEQVNFAVSAAREAFAEVVGAW